MLRAGRGLLPRAHGGQGRGRQSEVQVGGSSGGSLSPAVGSWSPADPGELGVLCRQPWVGAVLAGSWRRCLQALPACSCRSLAAQEGQVLLGFQSRGTKQPPGWWQGSPGGSLAAHSHFASALQDLGAAPAGARASSKLCRGWRLSGAAPEAGGELLCTASLGISRVSSTLFIMGFVCSSRRCSDSLPQRFQSVSARLRLPSSCLLGQLCAPRPLPVHWA